MNDLRYCSIKAIRIADGWTSSSYCRLFIPLPIEITACDNNDIQTQTNLKEIGSNAKEKEVRSLLLQQLKTSDACTTGRRAYPIQFPPNFKFPTLQEVHKVQSIHRKKQIPFSSSL